MSSNTDAAAAPDADTRPACARDQRYIRDVSAPIIVRLETEEVPWAQAQATCEAEGAYLAIPDDEPKRTYVNTITVNQHTWIGLTADGSQLDWRWVDGRAFSVSAVGEDGWGANKPDSGPPNQECARITGGGVYDDENCGGNRDFLCQCDL